MLCEKAPGNLFFFFPPALSRFSELVQQPNVAAFRFVGRRKYFQVEENRRLIQHFQGEQFQRKRAGRTGETMNYF